MQSLVDFLDRHRNRLTKDQVANIMRRAESFCEDESFHEAVVKMIFDENPGLAEEFLSETKKIIGFDLPPEVEFGFTMV